MCDVTSVRCTASRSVAGREIIVINYCLNLLMSMVETEVLFIKNTIGDGSA